MFIDSGIVVGSSGEAPPLMKRRKEMKSEEARKEYKQLIKSGWQVTEPKWIKHLLGIFEDCSSSWRYPLGYVTFHNKIESGQFSSRNRFWKVGGIRTCHIVLPKHFTTLVGLYFYKLWINNWEVLQDLTLQTLIFVGDLFSILIVVG